MTRRRLVRGLSAAVSVVLVGGIATSSYAQIPVTDVAALVKHVAMSLIQSEIKDLRHDQAERLYKMSLRLWEWADVGRYAIDRDDQPEWRIHNWFTDDVLYAKPYHWALTYGDSTGEGYAHVTLPRLDAGVIGPDAESLRIDQAMIDLADSAIIRGTHETGRLRYNGRAEAEAIIALDAIATADDAGHSLAAALDKVTAAQVIEAQNKQTRTQLETAILEQLLLEQTWDRNSDAALNNMRLARLRARLGGEDGGLSVTAGATEVLNHWRIP